MTTVTTQTPSADYGMSPAEAAETLFPHPSFANSPDGAELVRQVQRAVKDYLDDATALWLAEEAMYQAALMSRKLGRPLDFGYIGTVTIQPAEELTS